MIRLVQHIPNFCEGFDPKVAEVTTQAALLAVPWVATYAADVEAVEREGIVSGLGTHGTWIAVPVIHAAPRAQRFHQWSLSDQHLMVEHNAGRRWWVVGTITRGLDQLTLPAWTPHPDGIERYEAPAVRYRCAEHGGANAECCLKAARR